MGYIASVSKILQSVETTGNSQLTLDDAIYFDHGTRMAILMFDTEGERRLPEPTTAECEAIRLHNWMERGNKTSIKTDLAELTAQMGKVSEVREVERAIPRVKFATDICLTKMSLVMKYIAAKLTCETYAETPRVIPPMMLGINDCVRSRLPKLQKSWVSLRTNLPGVLASVGAQTSSRWNSDLMKA